MSYVAVGVAAAGIVMSWKSGEDQKSAASKQAAIDRQVGEQNREAAEFEANRLDAQAIQKVAAAQQQSFEVKRVSDLTASRAIALAAADGGGLRGSSLKVVSDIYKRGALNAGIALYNGEEEARVMHTQADQLRKQGGFTQEDANLTAEVTETRGTAAESASNAQALQIAGGMYAKYGGRGPSTGYNSEFYSSSGRFTPAYGGGTAVDPAYG